MRIWLLTGSFWSEPWEQVLVFGREKPGLTLWTATYSVRFSAASREGLKTQPLGLVFLRQSSSTASPTHEGRKKPDEADWAFVNTVH